MDKEADPEKQERHQYPFRLSGKGSESARERKICEGDGHHDCEQKQLIGHRRAFRRQNPPMSSRSLNQERIVEISVVAASRCGAAPAYRRRDDDNNGDRLAFGQNRSVFESMVRFTGLSATLHVGIAQAGYRDWHLPWRCRQFLSTSSTSPASAARPSGMWLSTFTRFLESSIQRLFSGVILAPCAVEDIVCTSCSPGNFSGSFKKNAKMDLPRGLLAQKLHRSAPRRQKNSATDCREMASCLTDRFGAFS